MTEDAKTPPPGTNPKDESDIHDAAVELGRRGGLKGGPARARKLTKDRRVAIAKHAANVRWAKYRGDVYT
jgi:hypothetical protein